MGGCASKMADSSPAKMKSEQQLGDVSSILQKLKDEVAYLQDEVEAKGAGFYVPLANQLNATRAAMEELTCTLDSCNGGLRSKDADMIPAAVGGAGAVDGESDFGKSIRLIQKSASGARAAYQYAENLKNNDKAKKVGMMLEKLARGMVHRIFTAFIRHFQECAEERAAQDAINARLSGLDEANRAKIKV